MATNKKKEAVGRVLAQVRDSQAAMSTAAGASKGADLSADLEVVWISTMAETYKTDIAGIVDDAAGLWSGVEADLEADHAAMADEVEEDSPEARWPLESCSGPGLPTPCI